MIGGFGDILAMESWQSFVNYELVRGNSIWRFAMVLAGVLATMIIGRIAQYTINNYATKREQKKAETGFTSTLKALSKPVYVGIVAIGINFCKIFHFLISVPAPLSENIS